MPNDTECKQSMLDSLGELCRRIAIDEVTCIVVIGATAADGPYSLCVGDFEQGSIQIIAGLTVLTNDLCHLIGTAKKKHADPVTH